MMNVIQPPYLGLLSNKSVAIGHNECLGTDFSKLGPSFASGVWTANRLIFVPLLLNEPLVVSQFFWENGATAAGNTDVGIYNFAGTTKLGSSASTANAGTSQIQVVDVANFTIPANTRMWLALGSDSGTQTYLRSSMAVSPQDFIGVTEQLSGWSSGLPASITPAAPTVASLPLFGFTGASVI